ncbi:unnamed protein product [Gadus morhua 'NCC']
MGSPILRPQPIGQQDSQLRPARPAFTLEGKAREATASREDGGAGGASSLSGDTGPDWLSRGPATLPLSQGDVPPGPWQSESLLAESWSTMGDPDPEDAKSLDSSEGGVLLPGEENNSSPSDMVHLEREDEEEEAVETEEEEEEEEAEEVETAGGEEEDDMQSSVLSMLGGEQELEELRREQEEEEEEQQPRHLSSQLLVAVAEDALRAGGRRHLSGREASTATAPMPIFKFQPPSSTSTPVPSITSSSSCRPSEVVEEQRYSRQELLPPPVLVPVVAGQPAAAAAAADQPRFSQIPLGSVGDEKVPGHRTPQNPTTEAPAAAAEPAGSTDLPMMLCGGAVLVAVVGVVAYGALAYGRK